MAIAEGDRLPEGTLLRLGEGGPEGVAVSALTKGRNVVIFAVPGAFTPTCHSAHLPSFIRTRDQFAAKGVDEVICVAVNDPFVMKAWDEATGASAGGITMLSDAGAWTAALGLAFDAPAAGLMGRSQRYAMQVVDGKVMRLYLEEVAGQCEISAGESLLAAI